MRLALAAIFGLSQGAGIGQPAGLQCVKWRRTLNCEPTGPRDQLQDLPCDATIEADVSGFCECESMQLTKAVGCGHTPFTCAEECAKMKRIWREVFGADQAGSSGPTAAPVPPGGDPYAQAQEYGDQAVSAVNQAVDSARQALDGAKDMMSRMMAQKPWEQVAEAGKQAEMAGKKAQAASQLARPFIYVQRRLRSGSGPA